MDPGGWICWSDGLGGSKSEVADKGDEDEVGECGVGDWCAAMSIDMIVVGRRSSRYTREPYREY